ncbi:platelet-activating factor receptor-like [Rhea pennata]|uniref:platelet-activating factor receptor-like n=1 Tax=Rhea pennata TaxID=8795 RepID=UPI002E263435
MNLSAGRPGECVPSDPLQFVLVPAVYCLVLCVGLPGNLAALLVFLQSGGVRKAIRIYLINLTLADILFNLTLPLWIPYYLAGGDWRLSEAACRLAGAAYYLATYSAVAFMALISVNRYCTTFPAGAGGTKCFEHDGRQRAYAYAMVGFFAGAFLVVLGAYASMARSLSAPAAASPGSHRRQARAMVLGMLLVFAVCVAPYHLTLAPWVGGRAAGGCGPPAALDVLHTLSVALLSLNSCIDPLVYCFAIKRFRAELCSALRPRWLGPCSPLQKAGLLLRDGGLGGTPQAARRRSPPPPAVRAGGPGAAGPGREEAAEPHRSHFASSPPPPALRAGSGEDPPPPPPLGCAAARPNAPEPSRAEPSRAARRAHPNRAEPSGSRPERGERDRQEDVGGQERGKTKIQI